MRGSDLIGGSSRVSLVPRLVEHADPLFDMLRAGRVLDTLVWDGPASREEFRETYPLGVGPPSHRHFTILEGDAPAGAFSIRPGEDPRFGDIGYWVGEPFQGRGVGTAAVARALELAFGAMGMERVEATVFVGNASSRRILEKCGFVFEGILPRAVCKRGVWMDEWRFSIERGRPAG